MISSAPNHPSSITLRLLQAVSKFWYSVSMEIVEGELSRICTCYNCSVIITLIQCPQAGCTLSLAFLASPVSSKSWRARKLRRDKDETVKKFERHAQLEHLEENSEHVRRRCREEVLQGVPRTMSKKAVPALLRFPEGAANL